MSDRRCSVSSGAGPESPESAPSPVYALFRKQGLADVSQPPLDTPLLRDLAFHEHTGRHAILASDWKVFVDFADRYLKKAPGKR